MSHTMPPDTPQTPQQKPSDGVIADTIREFAWCTLIGAVLGAITLAVGGTIWFGITGLVIGLIAGVILGAIAGAIFFVWINGFPYL